MSLESAIASAVTSAILRPIPSRVRDCGNCRCTECNAVQRRRFHNVTKERRLADGLCVDCGKVPHADGIQRCEACRVKFDAYLKAYSAKRRAS